jgi:hypothetical protein
MKRAVGLEAIGDVIAFLISDAAAPVVTGDDRQGEWWRAWLARLARAALESLREPVCCGHRLGPPL